MEVRLDQKPSPQITVDGIVLVAEPVIGIGILSFLSARRPHEFSAKNTVRISNGQQKRLTPKALGVDKNRQDLISYLSGGQGIRTLNRFPGT